MPIAADYTIDKPNDTIRIHTINSMIIIGGGCTIDKLTCLPCMNRHSCGGANSSRIFWDILNCYRGTKLSFFPPLRMQLVHGSSLGLLVVAGLLNE